MELDYDDIQPGVSEKEKAEGWRRVAQIVLGVLLVAGGIVLLPLPGPGWVIIIAGLNQIKPDNFLVKFLRKKIPGIPEEGPIPKGVLVVGGLFIVASTIFGIFYGAAFSGWLRELVGL